MTATMVERVECKFFQQEWESGCDRRLTRAVAETLRIVSVRIAIMSKG